MLKIDFISPFPKNQNIPVQAEFPAGKITVLYGPSGCGKTTVLRCISGLIKPSSGLVQLENVTWFDSNKKLNIKPQERKTAFVFQDLALFPNLSVENNLKAANTKNSNDQLQQIIREYSLNELKDRKPINLSGGEKQRLALARSLAMDSSIILLDEPFASVDISLKYQLYNYVQELANKHGKHVILVSHDVHEVIELADYILAWTKNGIIFSDQISSTLKNILGVELWQKLAEHSSRING